ncbi:hypothetical protein [Nibribacter koreensis]
MALIGFVTSCTSASKQNDELSEFYFPHKEGINNDGGHLTSFSESRMVENGGTYRIKVFLANRDKVYDGKVTEPIIKYKLKDFTTWSDVRENGISAKVIDDTAYLKFTVKDDKLKKEQIKIETLYFSIIIPRPNGDTVFSHANEYAIKGK